MIVRTRFFITAVSVLVAISSLGMRPARAQWTVVKSFGVEVESIYFLDQQGAPATGFAGLANSKIWRTTDNGQTWNQMTTPYTAFPLQVTDFAFSNQQLGWCSARSYFYDTGELWKTTNGGVTWDSIYSGGAFASIAYSPATGILVAPCWSLGTDSSIRSTDSGTTWKPFAPEGLNGATFSGFDGVISNIFSPNPLYTNDGGKTWNAPLSVIFDTVEIWSPHAIPGTSTFVADAEKTLQYFLSTDGGVTWITPHTFNVTSYLTGCTTGTLAGLFVQTEGNGFYFSSDTGKSWSSICGPNNSRDTRFYSIGKSVFAGDYSGNLWYSQDATVNADPTLGLETSSLNFFGARCTTSDTILHFFYGAGCDTAALTKVQILTGGPTFSVQAPKLPTFFSGVDSISVLYAPSLALHDTGSLLLEFILGTRLVDTIIPLYGTGRNTASFSQNDSLVLSAAYACVTKDTSIVIHNLSCDTLTITSSTLSGKPIFQLIPLPLPHKIAPLDSVAIQLTVSSQLSGTFRSLLLLSMVSGGNLRLLDSVPITLNVLRGAEAELGALDLSVLNACAVIDTVFEITNSSCNSITVLSATLNDSSIFQLGTLPFPATIKTSGLLNLPVRIVPRAKGVDTTLLHLQYRSGQAIVDTVITLTLQVRYNLPLHVNLADSAFNFGSVGVPCGINSMWITFHNGLCRDLAIKQISWENSNSAFSFDPIPLPDTLASDTGADSIFVHFAPTAPRTASNRLRITLELNGTEFDTVLTISGTGIQAFHDTVLTPVVQFDSVAACLLSERDSKIVNLSCDSVTVTSVVLAGNQGYSIIGFASPSALNHGDTLRLSFQFQPKQIGPASDVAILTLHDFRNDSDYTDTITLTGYVLAGRHALALSSSAFSLTSIAPCSELDSFLVLTNRGCDNVIIKDSSFSGYSGIQFLPRLALPITIAPDSFIRIPFRILPNRDSLEITLLALRGQNIDTTITFTYAALPGAPALTLSMPDTVFATRPCVPISKTFWITNTGCESDILDTLTLMGAPGASQFTLQSIPSLPDTLGIGDSIRFTVQFDPTGNGNGLATLDVTSQEANYARSIGLSGTVSGTVPSARVAIEASDGTLQTSGMANNLTSIRAKLLDDIGDSSALSTVSITLHTNWNLLTPLNFTPAPGWSVLNTTTLPDGDFQIRIRHDAGGAVASGTTLVTCSLFITVSDSTACDIVLSNLRFNDAAPTYEDCMLSSVAMPDSVHFTEIDTCGTPELRGSMEGRLALKIISIIPNPAAIFDGSARMNLNFSLARACDVRIIIRDVMGREYFHSVQPFTTGLHLVNLLLPGATEGIYFIELEAAGYVAEAKAVVQNLSAAF